MKAMTDSENNMGEQHLHIVPEDATRQRVDKYIIEIPELSITRSRVQRLIEDGHVLVNGEVPVKRYQPSPGDRIEITIPPVATPNAEPENIPLDIRYQDEHLIVVNKPAGMVTHPAVGNHTGTLVNALLYHFDSLPTNLQHERPGIVHRLDKQTSGLLVVALNEKTLLALQAMMQARDIHRSYTALIWGHMVDDKGEINAPVGRSTRDRKKMAINRNSGREAITQFKVIKSYRAYDLLELQLLTGRTHQIRVHLTHIGHPVVGDPDYGGRTKNIKGIFAPERALAKELLEIIERQALHACKLEFDHPILEKNISVEAELPHDFRKLISVLDEKG